MSRLTGVKITFPDDNEVGEDLVFRARSASVEHRIERTGLSGGGDLVPLATEIAGNSLQDVQASGRRQSAVIDAGGGVHVTTVRLTNWEGSSDRWGATFGVWGAGGQHPVRQLQTLDNAFRKIRVDSQGNAIKLETGEYSDDGLFEPLEVAPREPAVSFDPDEQASTFNATIEFVDIVDLAQAGESLLRSDG